MKLPSPGRKVDNEARGAEKVAPDHHIERFWEMGQDREISLDCDDFSDLQFAVEYWDINGLPPSRSLVKYTVYWDAKSRGQPWVDARVIGPSIDQSNEVSYPFHGLWTTRWPGDDSNRYTRTPTEIMRGRFDGDPVPTGHSKHDGLSPRHGVFPEMSDQESSDGQRRDKLLLRLLETPPRREHDKGGPTRGKRKSRARVPV